jgi:DNA-binding NarL/FixJ family response regulator
MNKLRIFLADDHAVVREGLKALVNAQPDMEVIGEAHDGEAACEQVPQLQVDVVVLDVSMPGMSGAQAAEQMRQECPQIKVLALTVHEDKGYLRQLLEAGAVGYILKRAAAEELIRAIRAVAAGGVYLDPALAGKVVRGFVRKHPAKDAVEEGELSDRESAVVRLVAAGHSKKKSPGSSRSASRPWRRTRPARWKSSACTAGPTSCATPYNGGGCKGCDEQRLPGPAAFPASGMSRHDFAVFSDTPCPFSR